MDDVWGCKGSPKKNWNYCIDSDDVKTEKPSERPTQRPTRRPSESPTQRPTPRRTRRPSPEPSPVPTVPDKIFQSIPSFTVKLVFKTPAVGTYPAQNAFQLPSSNEPVVGTFKTVGRKEELVVGKYLDESLSSLIHSNFPDLLPNFDLLEIILNLEVLHSPTHASAVRPTELMYVVNGVAVFKDQPGALVPTREAIGAAIETAFDPNVLHGQLKATLYPLLESIENVSIDYHSGDGGLSREAAWSIGVVALLMALLGLAGLGAWARLQRTTRHQGVETIDDVTKPVPPSGGSNSDIPSGTSESGTGSDLEENIDLERADEAHGEIASFAVTFIEREASYAESDYSLPREYNIGQSSTAHSRETDYDEVASLSSLESVNFRHRVDLALDGALQKMSKGLPTAGDASLDSSVDIVSNSNSSTAICIRTGSKKQDSGFASLDGSVGSYSYASISNSFMSEHASVLDVDGNESGSDESSSTAGYLPSTFID